MKILLASLIALSCITNIAHARNEPREYIKRACDIKRSDNDSMFGTTLDYSICAAASSSSSGFAFTSGLSDAKQVMQEGSTGAANTIAALESGNTEAALEIMKTDANYQAAAYLLSLEGRGDMSLLDAARLIMERGQ